MQPKHRKLTERERNRMMNIYASGPLTYKPEIDDPLFELDLISFYDSTEETEAVEAKHGTEHFYAKDGGVLKEWYGPDKPKDDMALPEGMTCRHCAMFNYCSKYCGAKETRTSCDWAPSRFKEMIWSVYALTFAIVQEIAVRKDLSLEGVDMDDIIHYVRKGVEAALDNRDEIIADAIRQAGTDAEREIQGVVHRA